MFCLIQCVTGHFFTCDIYQQFLSDNCLYTSFIDVSATHTHFAVNVKKKNSKPLKLKRNEQKIWAHVHREFQLFQKQMWNIMKCDVRVIISNMSHPLSILGTLWLLILPIKCAVLTCISWWNIWTQSHVHPSAPHVCLHADQMRTDTWKHRNISQILQNLLGSNDLSCCPHTLAVYQLCLFLIIRNHYKISLLDSNILATNHRSQYSENVQIWLYLHIWYSVDCSWLSV